MSGAGESPRRVLVIGGAHLDRRGRISGQTALGSSNPGHWFEEAGGGGFNAARGLALLGRGGSVLAGVEDAEGEDGIGWDEGLDADAPVAGDRAPSHGTAGDGAVDQGAAGRAATGEGLTGGNVAVGDLAGGAVSGGGASGGGAELGLASLHVAMVSPRGGDAEGEAVAAAARAAGVEDCAFTFLDRRTPTYTAILERDGNLVVALADMALYALFSPRRLRQRALRERIETADLVLLDANLPSETLGAALVAAKSAGRETAAIAISPAKVERLLPHLPLLDWLFLNEAEAAVVCSGTFTTAEAWAEALSRAGLTGAVLTRGAEPAVILSPAGRFLVAPPLLPDLADVTGAGDALAAGVLAGLLSGETAGEALRLGVAAAAITVCSPFAVAPDLSPARLAAQLLSVPAALALADPAA